MRLSVLLIALVAAPLTAQTLPIVLHPDVNDLAAYDALMLTPVGALSPIATSTMLDQRRQGAALAIRYGYVPTNGAVGFNNLGATALLPIGLSSTVSLTGGTSIPTCHDAVRDCSPGLMLGAGGDVRLASFRVAAGVRGTLGVNGELGYGKPRNVDHEYSGSVGLPITITIGTTAPGMRIVPFVTPAFGFGDEQVSSGAQSTSGQRFMIGGGIALTNPATVVVANLGFQHVVIDGGKTQVGISVTF